MEVDEHGPRAGQTIPSGLAAGLAVAAVELVGVALGPHPPSVGSIGWIFAGDLGVAAAISLVARRVWGDHGAGPAAGLTTLGLLLAWAAPAIAVLVEEGQAGALVLVAAPVPVAVGAVVAARRIARWGRAEATATALAGAAVIAASIVPVLPRPGAPTSPSAGPSVLVVTVDGLGAGAVPEALAALTAGGVVFTDAVTPTPASRPANAVVLTGVHPLRNGVLTERDRLSRAFPTLFEALRTAGWDTGAFVSSAAVDRRSGLAQGFRTFDDGWTGAHDAAVARLALGLFTRVADPGRVGRWSSRDDRATAKAFARWAQARDTPWAAWVHLSDPHRGGATLAEAATAIGAALEPDTVVVVTGTHGELPGGRGSATLAESVVHVPLAMRLPGVPAGEVGAQVRTLDIAATVLAATQVDAGTETEGLPLIGYATGARQVSLSCSLVGQDLDGNWLVGLRSDRVKVVTGPGDAARLYLLDADPDEQVDRSAEQPGVMAQARGAITADRAALAGRLR